MWWRSEIDYHGSRSYEADGPKTRPWTAVIAWLGNIGRRKAMKPAARRKSSDGLPPGAQRGFSLLGASSPEPKHDPVDCPFPLKSGTSPYGHDWRVLP